MRIDFGQLLEFRFLFGVLLGLVIVARVPFVAAAAEEDAASHNLKNPDGTWKWTNHLIHETSPYLLLHAHNPVEWYSWGPEALEQAKQENKPIFLSVGYSTCYWCHVMEREVFSNPEIAKLMNQWFISIKVDREERPDLDEIYMTATQLITRHGGWPNSVFLTPDLKPFYAGTYFPPEDKFGRPGFPRVLQDRQDDWTNQRQQVLTYADRVAEAIAQATGARLEAAGKTPLNQDLVTKAVISIRQSYDSTYGGFGSAPKFPSPSDLEFLLAVYQRSDDEQLLKMVSHTLSAMAHGGMYDQIGGGFHRYSTDARWLVPHFEKMLYDNAQLAKVYLQAYHLTKDPLFKRIAEETFEFVLREMTEEHRGFYSALDAEVDAEEGKYYVWTQEEIRHLLGKKDAKLFMKVYGADKASNFEGGRYVLYLPEPISKIAKEMKMSEEKLLSQLDVLKTKMLDARQKRKLPLLDTKTITSWNGLMVDAFAYAYEVLDNPRYRDVAQNAADFILKSLRTSDGHLMRTYKDDVVKYDGYLDDYTFLVRGLLGLYRATGEQRWLTESQNLTDTMIKLFWDEKQGGFYFTISGQKNLMVRTKNPYDSAIPSGNAVAVNNLLAITKPTGQKDYLRKAQKTLESFAGMMAQSPRGFMHMLLATNQYLATDWDAVFKAAKQNPKKAPQLLEGSQTGHTAAIDPSSPPKPLDGGQSALPESQNWVQASASVSSKKITHGKPFEVKVRLKIAKGWHINANPASMDFLIPTALSVDSDLPVEMLSVKYPKGKKFHFEFSEQPLAVYQCEVTIQAKLKLKASAKSGQKGVLRLQLKYQACDDQRCMPPSVSTIQLKLSVS